MTIKSERWVMASEKAASKVESIGLLKGRVGASFITTPMALVGTVGRLNADRTGR